VRHITPARTLHPTYLCIFYPFFFFNDTATTEIYTLSLHDALPISGRSSSARGACSPTSTPKACRASATRSEEHTSELQSHSDLVCRLLLEKPPGVRVLGLAFGLVEGVCPGALACVAP